MNGAHDLGGQMGFGPVEPEANEPVFHAPWERRALGLTLAVGALGQWNIDMSRSARESIHPARYLALSYYEIWLEGIKRLMLARAMIEPAEWPSSSTAVSIEEPSPTPSRLAASSPGLSGLTPLPRSAVDSLLKRGSPTLRALETPARFAVGDSVCTILAHPSTHTRLPRYARGKAGKIVSVHGAHLFADSNAQGDPQVQWLYTVCFKAHELWGPHTSADEVCVDCWESYLLEGPCAGRSR
jgi:nitrile hydratase subunit beta